MIAPALCYAEMQKRNLDFFTGVPDSLLKDFLAYLADVVPPSQHIITPNEGNAVALAAGYHLATGKYGVVYMQNSGLGNAVNPLTSLADSLVYGIPLVLLIGWRGEEGVPDEPQHKKMGLITLRLLETLGLPYCILENDVSSKMSWVESTLAKTSAPCALIVREGTFARYEQKKVGSQGYDLTREEALTVIVSSIEKNACIVSTTGKTSRELFEIREKNGQTHAQDFLTVGSMGHASSIALGIALQKPSLPVYCLDGDGALIMHMGILSTVGTLSPPNFRHVVLNNYTHDSVGGQETSASVIDMAQLARACGYKEVHSVSTARDITTAMQNFADKRFPVFLEIKIKGGARKDLKRPTTTPRQNKDKFMDFLQKKSL